VKCRQNEGPSNEKSSTFGRVCTDGNGSKLLNHVGQIAQGWGGGGVREAFWTSPSVTARMVKGDGSITVAAQGHAISLEREERREPVR